MANNWKYTLQKHKGKLWLSGSILATAIIGAGTWLVVSEDSPFSEPEEVINYLASHIITSGVDGQVSLLSVENNETLNTITLPVKEGYLYTESPNREAVYAYDGENLMAIREVGGELSSELIAEGLPKVPKATQFAYADNVLSVYSKDFGTVMVIDTTEKTVVNTLTEKEPVVQLVVSGEFTYYITDSELVRVNMKDIERIELGSTLLSLHSEEGKLVIQSAFGNTKGENVLFYANSETLEIESLQKTGAPDTIMLSKDDGESYFMAGHYVGSEKPYYLLERYKVGAEGLTKDSLSVQVPIGEKLVSFNAENSVLDHDYIYSHDEASLKVFDVKSQSFIHDVPVNVDFAMPVLTEGGRGGGEDE